jgi:hypothetical protein
MCAGLHLKDSWHPQIWNICISRDLHIYIYSHRRVVYIYIIIVLFVLSVGVSFDQDRRGRQIITDSGSYSGQGAKKRPRLVGTARRDDISLDAISLHNRMNAAHLECSSCGLGANWNVFGAGQHSNQHPHQFMTTFEDRCCPQATNPAHQRPHTEVHPPAVRHPDKFIFHRARPQNKIYPPPGRLHLVTICLIVADWHMVRYASRPSMASWLTGELTARLASWLAGCTADLLAGLPSICLDCKLLG